MYDTIEYFIHKFIWDLIEIDVVVAVLKMDALYLLNFCLSYSVCATDPRSLTNANWLRGWIIYFYKKQQQQQELFSTNIWLSFACKRTHEME